MSKEKSSSTPKGGLSFFDFSNSQNLITAAISTVLVLIVGFSIFNYFSNVNKEKAETSSEEAQVASEVNLTNEDSSENQSSQQAETYTVKPGDTLWKISQEVYQDGYRWEEISRANNLDSPDSIHEGNVLIIPRGQVSGTSVAAAEGENLPESAGATGGGSYIVREGDSLWSIAEHYYGNGYDWYRIDQANDIEKMENGRPLIKPGQRITIP
jgi:nucleoid-associated protein YgaU